MKEVSEKQDELINPFTKTKSVIIHRVGNSNSNHRACYDAAYQNIMNRSKKQSQFPIDKPLIPKN